jgi:putative nucleotidyltransferase with HDIG domain
MAPWHETAIKRGYQSSIALPLISEGQAFGSLNIYSVEPDFFTAEEATLLEELANDLAYGIITLRTREAHEQQATILRQNLEQSIQTIAATVEARDPYTAGHQKRVAELATAIAQEMGLPEEQINGIHLAATIHDLGKIRVPAEILSKPGILNAVEFQLIQMHPQEGYDILKEVKFPWPIANIILQHHEKLDGSGYPQGLRGDAILLEAKILTVADVVEAMSSHRPYRAGLGIDTALAEIEAQRGIQFDPVVVDACLKLFRERGYTIPD